MGWPIVGETIEFGSTLRKGIPEKFVADRMAKYSPDVFKTSLIGEPVAVLCGSAGHKFLSSNENKLVAIWFPPAVAKVFPPGAEHPMTRRLASGFQSYVKVMDSIAKRHFETKWDSKEEVTVAPLAKDYTFEVACGVFLSIEDLERIASFSEPFYCLLPAILSSPVAINFPGTPLSRGIKAANKIRKTILEIIRQRKTDLMEKKSAASAKYDVLSHMLVTTNEEGNFMNEMEITEKLMILLVGGFHTTSTVITCILKWVSAAKRDGEPLNWEDIQKMKYSWNVASEVLRLTPPSQGMFRQALTDFTYAGFSIPKGWKIYCSTSSTNKNPDYFPEPEKFDPSRFEGDGPAPYTYIPFGAGPRMCPGKEYARFAILVFMYNVVGRFKWETVHPNEKIFFTPFPLPEKGLPIRLFPH
ncbi:hypothetical protein RHGRI_037461 [Rhododendron griersonianum]|uniref:Cytochrome P450 n=1 Tax=Rhododendron griersonianum TaxID=479676 RepID=A0AAV6HXF9_9ERIC|nr:hypothetical protein RHGRI_037461 [Rhododendron griersonianum]